MDFGNEGSSKKQRSTESPGLALALGLACFGRSAWTAEISTDVSNAQAAVATSTLGPRVVSRRTSVRTVVRSRHILQKIETSGRSARLVQMAPTDNDPASAGALEETLRDKRFGMVFQPIVDLTRRRVFAYEALVRPQLHSSPPALIADGARCGRLGLLGRTLREASIAGCPDHPLFINVQPDELL